jgi:hypothetical protein
MRGECCMESKEKTEIIDSERLKWISFFHYLSGAMTILFSLISTIYLIFFAFIAFNPEFINEENMEQAVNAQYFMKIFFAVFSVFVLAGIIYGICEIVSGLYIKQRKNRVFSLIVAIPRILFFPYGTILSIFTLMMLERDSVKEQYEKAKNT